MYQLIKYYLELKLQRYSATASNALGVSEHDYTGIVGKICPSNNYMYIIMMEEERREKLIRVEK